MIQIRVGKQKKKEKKKIYTENKIGRYVQFLIEREDFLELVASWLLSIEDERMQLLRQFIFEVELSETEELKKCFVSIWELSHREKLSGEKVFRIHGRAGAENGTESQGSGFAGSNRIKGESYRSLCKRRL